MVQINSNAPTSTFNFLINITSSSLCSQGTSSYGVFKFVKCDMVNIDFTILKAENIFA